MPGLCRVVGPTPGCSCSDREGESRDEGHPDPHTCVCGAQWTIVDTEDEWSLTVLKEPSTGWDEEA